MIAASIIMGRALAPLEQAIGGWKQAVQALEAKRRLTAFFRQAPRRPPTIAHPAPAGRLTVERSEEHTSELQSLMRISYAVFCLKKNKTHTQTRRMQQQSKHD